MKTFKTAEEAEQVIRNYGGEVEDERIERPVDVCSAFNPDWEEYWDAYDYLRKEHGYDSDADDVLFEF